MFTPGTSDVNWCEIDYQVVPFIAEFFNTLSSIPVAMFGLHGFIHIMKDYLNDYNYFDYYTQMLRWNRRKNHINNKNFSDSRNNHKKLGLVNAALHLMCVVVGVGSILFHSTLSWEGQALDELPMLWTSSLCLFAIHRISAKSKNSSSSYTKVSNLFGLFLLLVNVIITYAYFKKGFVLFFVTYSLTIGTMLVLSIMYVNNKSKENPNTSNTSIQAWQKRVLYTAGCVYVGGFLFLWVPEMIFCGNRRENFHDSIFTSLHLHAFFHLTSACGSYSFCVFAALADNALDVERNEDGSSLVGIVNEASWTSMFIPLPKVIKK